MHYPADTSFDIWHTRHIARSRRSARTRWAKSAIITSFGLLSVFALTLLTLSHIATTKGDAVEVNQPLQVTLMTPPAPPRLKDPGPLTQPNRTANELTKPIEVTAPLTPAAHPPLVLPQLKKVKSHQAKKTMVTPPKTQKSNAPFATKATAPPASQAPTQRHDLQNAAASNQARDNWLGRVYARLKSLRRYPPEEREEGIEGKVGIWFSIDRNGRVVASGLVSSSGNQSLDDAAVSLPKTAEPIPLPLNPETLTYPYRMTINIGYAIQ